MPETPIPAPKSPTTAQQRKPVVNLAREIEAAVPREALDFVRCVHLYDTFYRCNWWTAAGQLDTPREPLAPWAALANQRIRQSRFLSATLSPEGQLELTEVAATPSR